MVWLVVVSITNLGFGDIVPSSAGGRVFVGIASILGTLLTALMIGVMRDWLEIPTNERRILAAIKRQRKLTNLHAVGIWNFKLCNNNHSKINDKFWNLSQKNVIKISSYLWSTKELKFKGQNHGENRRLKITQTKRDSRILFDIVGVNLSLK